MIVWRFEEKVAGKIRERPWFLLSALALLVMSPSLVWADTTKEAQQFLVQGLDLHKRGIWGEAVLSLSQASQLFAQNGDRDNETLAMLTMAQSLDNLGRSHQALATLERATSLVNKVSNPEMHIRIHNTLGNIWLKLGETKNTRIHLKKALALASEIGHKRLVASIENDLGTMHAYEQHYDKAEELFTASFNTARDKELYPLMIASAMNLARIRHQQGRHEEAKKTIDSITLEIPKASDTSFKAFAYLNAGRMYTEFLEPAVPTYSPFNTGIYASSESKERIRGVYPRPANEKMTTQLSQERNLDRKGRTINMKQAYETLQSSRELAHRLKDMRTESFAVGFLGHLYEKEGRSEEGLLLTHEAIRLTQASSSIDSLYQWHWQMARLNAALGKREEAVKAYERARLTLMPVQRAILMSSAGAQRPFRERQGALFFEYANHLLQKAAETHEENEKQAILATTQRVIEDFKSAELQDYFQDACVKAALEGPTLLNALSLPKTAVIYPIILPDRVEILISIGGKIQQVIQNIEEKHLKKKVKNFLYDIQASTQNTYRSSAQELYDTIIAPMRTLLDEQSIDTLVFIPDGPLRTIPFAALYDGEKFLIEHYAIAYTPGLTLTGSRTQGHQDFKVLGVGLTEAVNGFSALPHVKQEIQEVQSYFSGTTLLDQDFNSKQFREELLKGAYNIVHLATHASFRSRDNGTFIQAIDGAITMDQLAEMIGVLKYGAQPLELITFSACETAIGGDQAVLGLAGSAIKSGAKSALASLWRIDDEATAEMIPEFYRHLKLDTQSNKAIALQKAQLKMIQSAEFSHPTYWSPFLLIGNWL